VFSFQLVFNGVVKKGEFDAI